MVHTEQGNTPCCGEAFCCVQAADEIASHSWSSGHGYEVGFLLCFAILEIDFLCVWRLLGGIREVVQGPLDEARQVRPMAVQRYDWMDSAIAAVGRSDFVMEVEMGAFCWRRRRW